MPPSFGGCGSHSARPRSSIRPLPATSSAYSMPPTGTVSERGITLIRMTDIRAAFDRGAADYDRPRRQFVPPFDAFYGALVEAVPFPHDAPIDVLDLGAGTGLVSALLAAALPRARFTLVDLSAEMLDQARARFAAEPDRFSFHVADLAAGLPPGRYDAVVSALAIHHLADAEKRALYASVRAALRQPGVFVNADQVLGPTPAVERRYRETWLRQVRALGTAEPDVQLALDRMRFDRKATLAAQLAWLEELGFADVDCPYKSHEFAVLVAHAGQPDGG
jgi:tRNA (cmo5U34)-methyltransferase